MRGVRAGLLAAALVVPALATNEASAARAPAATAQPLCVTPPSGAANVNTDCERDANFFETSLAVNPTNPSNIVGAVIKIGPGGHGGSWWSSRG